MKRKTNPKGTHTVIYMESYVESPLLDPYFLISNKWYGIRLEFVEGLEEVSEMLT